MKRFKPSVIGAFTISAVTLAGCTGTGSQSVFATGSSPSGAPAASGRAGSPASQASSGGTAPDFSGTVTAMDSQGYKFQITYAYSQGPAFKSIANSPPGFADIGIQVSGNVEVANATPGRNAPIFSALNVALLFKSSRPVCKARSSNALSVISMKIPPGNYCAIFALHAEPPDPDTQNTLSPGETTAFSVSAGGSGPLTYPADEALVLVEIAESKAANLVADLDQGPDAFALTNYEAVLQGPTCDDPVSGHAFSIIASKPTTAC